MVDPREEFRWRFFNRPKATPPMLGGRRRLEGRAEKNRNPFAFAEPPRPARRSGTRSAPRGPVAPVPAAVPGMAHEIAKLLLEHAGTFLERSEAIRTAMSMGMPLDEIERFLDWLDASRGPVKQDQDDPPKDGPPKSDPKPPPKKG